MISNPMTQFDNNTTLVKYQKAGEISARVLDNLVNMAKPGVRVYDICSFGDKYIIDEVNKIYPDIKKNRKMKGND